MKEDKKLRLIAAVIINILVFCVIAAGCFVCASLWDGGAAPRVVSAVVLALLGAGFAAAYAAVYFRSLKKYGSAMEKIAEAFPEEERDALREMGGGALRPEEVSAWICERLKIFDKDDLENQVVFLALDSSKEIFWYVSESSCDMYYGDHWKRSDASSALSRSSDIRKALTEGSAMEFDRISRNVIKDGAGAEMTFNAKMELAAGRTINIRITGKCAAAKNGGYMLYGVAQDVENEINGAEALRGEMTKAAFLLNCTDDVLYEADVTTNTLKSLNPAASKRLFNIEDMGDFDSERRPYWEMIHPDYREGFIDRFFNYNHMLVMPEHRMVYEYRIKNSNGDYIWVEHEAQVLSVENGSVTKVIGRIRDINGRKLNDAQRQDSIDGVTGAMMMSAVKRDYDAPINKKGRRCVVLFDINRFRDINNEYGFRTGDEVLKHIVMILWSKQRGSCIVGRGEPDVFAIAMLEVNQHNDPTLQMTRVLDRLLEPVSLNGRVVNVSMCASCSSVFGEAGTFDEAYRQALFAMKICKQNSDLHSNSYVKYEDELKEKYPRLWEAALKETD